MKKQLPSVTLIGADHKFDRIKKAFEICQNYCDFGRSIIFSNAQTETLECGTLVIDVELNSIVAYSHFMVKRLNEFIDTTHVLVVQYDGFILNPAAWSDDFLNFDYIGAPWWYHDSQNVGNGGFSLRSKRLLEILADDPKIAVCHPEDSIICRRYGEYLKDRGIVFAPEHIAKKFSIEGTSNRNPKPVKFGTIWTSEFGFHGINKTDISNWPDWRKFFDNEYMFSDCADVKTWSFKRQTE